jgi:hypothetical protein
MIFNQQNPKKQTSNPICETYEKLKLIEKQLGRMNLLNNKYLYKRNSIYYFSIKLNNQTIKKSLQTTNFVYANILKYKIIYRLDKMDIKYNLNNMFIVQRAGDNINIIPENEAEKKLLDTVEASANNVVKRLSNKYDNVITNDYDKRVQLTLKQCGEEFLKLTSKTTSKMTMYKYNQCMDYLYVYFGENTKLSKLSVQNASRFRTFLIDVPKNYKKQDDLKNKDIKLLIENNSKSLDDERLQNDTLNYYDELHHQYYTNIDFQSLDRNDTTTVTIMMDSIYCENFILIDYVKRNFNILYMAD